MQCPGWLASLSCYVWLGLVLGASPAALAEPSTPAELHDWEGWALHGHEAHRCPWLVPGEPADASRVCAWPGVLELEAGARDGRFRIRWEVFTDSWLALPGDVQHWPEDLKIDGTDAPAVQHGSGPALRASPGAHVITGTFRWAQPPALLALPQSTALLRLTLEGKPVPAPQRDSTGVMLHTSAAASARSHLEVRVFRLLDDAQPAVLTTTLRLAVSGEAREETLPQVLPEGFVPIAIDSPLTTRLERDGTLRLQVRPGDFELTLSARGPSPVSDVKLRHLAPPWPSEEIWSFQAEDRLRVAAPEGAAATDPAQANVPLPWRQLPAYRLIGGAQLHIGERSRGLAGASANQLRLYRTAWLDFSGTGYTIVDRIQGEMRDGWRLDMRAPYSLQSARSGDGSTLLITGGADAALTGIELRTPLLAVTTLARVPRTDASLPASGWRSRFTEVSGELVTAPGYRLLVALGPDASPGAWLERWRLLDIFGVLLIATAAWRLAGARAGCLALLALVLTYQESGAPTWLWLSVLIALALVRAAPAGRLRQWAHGFRLLAFLALLLAFVPFAVEQARLALYPQLEALGQSVYGAPSPVMEAKTASVADVPASPPVPAPPGAAAADRAFIAMQSVVATAERREARPMAGYEPGTLLQAGPAIPMWRYHVYPFSYSGPVEADATARFIVSPPWLTRLWRVAALALSILLLRELLRAELEALRRYWPARARSLTAALLLLVLCSTLPPRAEAASTPDAGVLSELQRRLLAPPTCAPDCADVLAAQVSVDTARLQLVLTVSALDAVGLALPAADLGWVPDRIDLDGQAAGAIYRDASGIRYVLLPRGRHTLRLEGPAGDVVSLGFALPPHVIDVTAPDWDVSGVTQRHLASGALQLARRTSAAAAVQGEFPAFVSVARDLRLAHEWTLATRVSRIAPAAGGLTLRLPLLPGESVTSAGLPVRNNIVEVSLGSDEADRSFTSVLPITQTLELVATPATDYAEHWRFEVAPEWHVTFSGMPAVVPKDPGAFWLFEYFPRPGEHLRLTATRPLPVAGATVAFDRVELITQVGQRSRDATLTLHYRSTQGGRELLRLPANASVSMVQSDGDVLALRPTNGELSLSAVPGEHRWVVQWQRPQGVELAIRSEAVGLGSSAGNLQLNVALPQDRWVLFTSGAGVGPTVLYWGELIVFVFLAWLVARSGLSPLPLRDWLLLGLGLSSFSWFALALFAVFIAAFEWRARQRAPREVSRFKLLQLALGALAVIALAAVVAAVPQGLLAHPNMRIAGGDSGTLQWFVDRANGALPQVRVLSVSLWWYKLAMLAWALWLSFALIRWIRWAWQIYTREGLWPPLTPGAGPDEPRANES